MAVGSTSKDKWRSVECLETSYATRWTPARAMWRLRRGASAPFLSCFCEETWPETVDIPRVEIEPPGMTTLEAEFIEKNYFQRFCKCLPRRIGVSLPLLQPVSPIYWCDMLSREPHSGEVVMLCLSHNGKTSNLKFAYRNLKSQELSSKR
ncbi:hypothetical protein FH972_025493 [Carpinus fangiana]|uniref:Uncharacterized protein n=1 Tax=Carpinus fangiana TaxID=176857 RepID=A0A5N6L1A7_9ROSI|nr:hypothetical protein FH972_025493 [Carpinus fangiana]